MTANVVTHERFLQGDSVALKGLGIPVSDIPDSELQAEFADLELPEAKTGEEHLGYLTPDQMRLFLEYYTVLTDFKEREQELGADHLSQLSEEYRRGGLTAAAQGAQDIDIPADEFKALARLHGLSTLLQHVFYWPLKEQHDAHDSTLGIRARGRVVRVGTAAAR